MHITGRCFCGALHYEVDADPIFKGMCHCRECQYMSGGMANIAIAFPEQTVKYTKGTPKQFTSTEFESPATRDFCGDCGTQIISKSPAAAGLAILKVGSMDDPSVYDKPDTAIWMSEAESFHHVPEGVPTFPQFPPHE